MQIMLTPNVKLIMLVFLTFFYNAAIFGFIDTLLENRRISKKLMWGLYICNTCFFLLLFNSVNRNITTHYIIIIVLLFFELLILYKDNLLRITFVALAVSIHIMSVRAAALGLFSIVFKMTPFETNNSIFSLDSLNVTMSVLIACSLAVKKLIPAKSVKIIHQHKEQLIFMTTWLFVANGYFVFNSLVFLSKDTSSFTKYNIVIICLTLMIALYTVLLYTIRVGQLLGYKEKSDILQTIIEDQKQFKKSVIDQAVIGFEANLTENMVINFFGKEFDSVKDKIALCSYKELVENYISLNIHPEYIQSVTQFMNLDRLLACYLKGELDQSIEYPVMLPSHEEYLWIKALFNLYKSNSTDSIMMFTYAKDIDEEKKVELEIKSRSERDTLTGIYNHGMTKFLINDFLLSQDQHTCKGALLIIDIDNFKLINDNFGHGFGDEVLQNISQKLLSVFRCHNSSESIRKEDDIVGRIGGDEFMVFIKTSDIEGLKNRTQKICDMINNTYTTSDGKNITVSASVGIAIVKGQLEDFKTLYAKADSALYMAKCKGKNGYCFYNGEDFKGYQGDR